MSRRGESGAGAGDAARSREIGPDPDGRTEPGNRFREPLSAPYGAVRLAAMFTVSDRKAMRGASRSPLTMTG